MRMLLARCNGLTTTLCGAILLGVHIVGAQTVAGRVVAKSDGAAVGGAIVALLDSSGHVITIKLADDGGSFVLSALRAGGHSLRVERVGFRSLTTSPFLVRQGDTINVPITLASEGVSLRAVRISADRRCVVRPKEGLATAQLWEEARKALSSTSLTQLAQAAARARRDSHRFGVRLRKFSRDLEPLTLASLHDEQVELEGEVITPFVSADPEVLARDGYVAGNIDTGSTFFAPDADILLSDRFLDAHCFRLQAPERGRQDDLIGLAFEPTDLTSDGRHVEIRGVLWLDRATAELRYMDYGYVNLPFDATQRHVGGLVEFRPLPDGRWIVWRWYIRTPLLERRRVLGEPYAPGKTQIQIMRIREQGAEVLEVMPAGTRRAGKASLRGTVLDSLRGAPMAGVRVFLSGTSFAAVTAPDGSYSIDAVPPGKYAASILSPRLDSLLLDSPSRELTLSGGEEKLMDFGLPSLRTFSGQLCAAPMTGDTLAVVFGVARDTGGAAARGVTIRAEWNEILRAGIDVVRVRPITDETMTSETGRFALCGLPAETPITIRVRRGRATVAGLQLHVRPGEARRVDFTLRAR